MENIKKEIVEEFYHLIDENKGNEMNKIISDNFIGHDAVNKEKGLEELQNLIILLHKGFSNISHKIEQIHFIDKNKVFVRWKMTGKHTGEFFNISPSNKEVVLHGHDLFKISSGKIVEQWHIEQLLSLINQISNK
ncbi:MAG: hypothetical protein CR972_04695 [Candidatus Moraniibacteriota bacterium]|nr:MAG: hypothetical protein CR972_04695 [Candidatus Moranbacteria bacterium]